ncbi:MAG: helix-turn-helix domain-containing protein [Clostridia bacterium]|nr:helix-turn-helix domain-containing protein [Clostridia bacterium]
MDEENKKVYEAEDIQKILKIGKNKVYDFLEDVYSNTNFFKVIKIGKLYRVPKKSFDDWLNNEK